MSSHQLAAKPVTLSELFGTQRRYEIPRFQRSYAWEEDQWEELWLDVQKVMEDPRGLEGHFLGPIVLQDAEERQVQRVIDGQQRLITVTLLALALIHRVEALAAAQVEEAENRARAAIMRGQIVSTREASSLRERSRMRLNDEDDGFFATRLVQPQATPLGMGQARTRSEKRLLGALLHLRKRIDELLPADTPGSALAERLERVMRGVSFIEIRVSDEATAFLVFETLNARGVALNTADLTKNYLFALAAEGGAGDLAEMQAEWRRLSMPVGAEQVSALLFHALAGGAEGDLSERRVFTELKRVAPDRERAFGLVRRLEDAAHLVSALESAEHERWEELPDPPAARRAVRLLQALEAEQVRSLLLAAAPALPPEELGKLIERLPVLLLRAQLCKTNTGDLKRSFQRAAREVHRGAHRRAIGVLRSLRDVYPSDERFQADFALLAIAPSGRRKRLLRYLLGALEERLGGGPVAADDPKVTVEHILPERQAGAWEGTTQGADWVNRLGNLTLLELSLNRGLGGTPDWGRKQEVYAQSAYQMARQVVVSEGWGPDQIAVRQRELAALAVQIWRLDLDEPRPRPPAAG
jgi:hypothetical protein